MHVINLFIFSLLTMAQPVFSQENATGRKPCISRLEQEKIQKRSYNYAATIFIADSLYSAYQRVNFNFEEEHNDICEDGLMYIYQIYEIAANMTLDTSYCDRMQHVISAEMHRKWEDVFCDDYSRLAAKAEELYTAGNMKRAIEFYKRAVLLKPNDEQVKKRLEELLRE